MPRKKKQEKLKITELSIMRPEGYSITTVKVSEKLWRLRYIEYFDESAPDEVHKNTKNAIMAMEKAFYEMSGIKMGWVITKKQAEMQIELPFDVIASIIIGEFIGASRIGQITLIDMLYAKGLNVLGPSAVADIKPQSKEAEEYVKKKFSAKVEVI